MQASVTSLPPLPPHHCLPHDISAPCLAHTESAAHLAPRLCHSPAWGPPTLPPIPIQHPNTVPTFISPSTLIITSTTTPVFLSLHPSPPTVHTQLLPHPEPTFILPEPSTTSSPTPSPLKQCSLSAHTQSAASYQTLSPPSSSRSPPPPPSHHTSVRLPTTQQVPHHSVPTHLPHPEPTFILPEPSTTSSPVDWPS